MEVSSSHQVYVFFIYVLSGLLCGVFFDLQRVIRGKYAAGNVRTLLEDFAFAVFSVFMAIAPGYYFNNGEIRYYQLTGLLCGGIIYAAALSGLCKKILHFIVGVTENVIVVPIKKIYLLIIKPLKILKNKVKDIRKAHKKLKKRLSAHLKKRGKALKKRVKML